MTLNNLEPSQKGFLVNFLRFLVATHILRVNCAEMAEDRPGRFAQQNVHFLESTNSYFTAIGSRSLKTVADRQRHATYHNKQYSD